MSSPSFWFRLRLFALAVLLTAGPSAPAQGRAHDYAIGLSPFLEHDAKDKAYRAIIAFVVEQMPLDSSLHIYDAYNLRTVAELEVPEAQAFRSAKTRANQFATQIHSLRQFLAASHGPPGSNPTVSTKQTGVADGIPLIQVPGATAGVMSLGSAVRLPQFMDFLRSAKVSTKRPFNVIVLGSPLYVDPKEPSFSMVDGYFPSDEHLRVGREQSVYGVQDRTNTLGNTFVHLVWFGEPWVSDVHHEKVARFWYLFLRAQGGTLVTFTGDLATAFKNSRLQVDEYPRLFAGAELDPAQTKLEMLRVSREVASQDWITRDGVVGSSQQPAATSGPMKIGIRWQGNLDLDLYASAKPGSETLFFHHTRCPEGYYYKDHRSSPGREYEFIEFTSPIDLHQVEAMVNLYKGEAPGGASGEVRIEFEQRIYTGHFHIPASEGNRGRLDETQTNYWATLSVPEILHLRLPAKMAQTGGHGNPTSASPATAATAAR